MGKVKSAIITSIVVVAIAVLSFFALFSWQVPGTEGVDRYNSFISSIHMGGDLTGEAYSVLYPEGVIISSDYELGKPEDADKLAEYEKRYEKHGDVYFDTEVIEDGEEALKESVKADAAILNKRYAQKGYSSYSVSVQDDFAIRVSVPTNFTYAAYKEYDSSSRSAETTKISRTIQLLAFDGELTLRNSEVGRPNYDNILTKPKADITAYFKSIKSYSRSGNYAVRVNLTGEGREEFKGITENISENASSDKAIGFYIGENQLLSLTVSDVIDSKSFMISVSADYAQDYAIILNSVVHGEVVKLNYTETSPEIIYATSQLGGLASLLLGVAIILVLAALIVYTIVKYKKLGLVNTISVLIFALALITTMLLLEVQLTVAGAFFAVLGLALLSGSNLALFETVRKETKLGRTMQSSIKSGYKKLLAGILELHLILLVVSILLTFVAVGELASCGLILFISTISSYILYWFTRFMWYVTSSPVKDKFGFCGFVKEER